MRISTQNVWLSVRRQLPAVLGVGLLLCASVAGLVFKQNTANALTASTMNFQARLMNGSGSIAADGDYNVEFKLYNAAAPDGGETPLQGSCTTNPGAAADEDCVWVETRTSGNKVHVVNGYLTVNLGSVTGFASTIKWDQDLWLTMNVGGTGSPSWDGEMSPRLKLTAVPYAFKAGQLAQFNSSTGFTSTLNLGSPTVGDQIFNIQDQGAAGTYNILTAASGSDGYVKLQGATPGSAQTGNFNINGTGIAGILQAGALTVTSSATSGTAATITANSINTGFGLDITTGSAVTSGAGLRVTGSGATAYSANSGLVQVVNNGAFTGPLATIVSTGTTTGTLLNLSVSNASQTTASALNVVQAGVSTGYTGNLVSFTGSSTTGTGSVLSISTANTTAGNGLNLTANGITSGVGANLNHATSVITTGSLLRVASTAVDAFTTGGLAVVTSNTNFTTTANTAGLLNVSASATAAGTLVNIANSFATQTTSTALNVVQSGTTTGFTGNLVNFTGSSTTGAGNVVNITTANTTAGSGLSLVANGITTGNGANLTHATSVITTGSLLRVASTAVDAFTTGGLAVVTSNTNFTTTANTAGLLNVSASATAAGTLVNIANSFATQTTSTALNVVQSGTSTGFTGNFVNFTGSSTTGAGNVVNITTANTTAGSGLNVAANALTTGVGVNIGSTSTGLTSGSIFKASSSTTGAVATNGIVSLNATGNYTSTSNAGLLNVAANATTAGTVVNIQGTSLTTGVALNVASAASTGTAIRVASGLTTLTGATTGDALNVSNATSSGNIALFSDNATAVLTIANGGGALFRNETNGTTALQIQSATGAETLFNIDTSTRTSGVAGNTVKIGNSTGTDVDTTILQLDGAASVPTTNLASLNGGLFYNSGTGKVSIIEGGVVKAVCNSTDLACGSGTVSLQGAYNGGKTILTSGGDLAFTLAGSDNFTVTTSVGATGSSVFSLADGANPTPPSQLVSVTNNDVDQIMANGIVVGAAAGGITDGLDVSDTDLVNAVNVGDNIILGTTATIDFSNFDVSSAGAVTAAGLIQGNAGLTITGAVSLNTTGTANTSIGNATGTFDLNSNAFDVSSTGALSGITTIATSSTINSQTISSAANFTGTVTIQGSSALTLGVTGTSTGAILFKGLTGASGTLTVAGPATPNAGNYTLSIPAITNNANFCTDNSVCTGYQAAPASGSYIQTVPTGTVNVIQPTAASVIALTVNGTSNATGATALVVNQTQANDAVNVTTSSTGTNANGIVISRSSAGTTSNALSITNATGTTTNGISFGGTIGTDINRASGVLTIQGAGGMTLSTTGATTLAADSGAAGTVNLGNTNATTIALGGASGATTTIAGGNVAHTVSIASGGTSTIQGVTIGSTGSTSTVVIQGGTGTSTGDINIGDQTTAGKIIDIGSVDNVGTSIVRIATAAAVQTVTIGSTNSTSTTTIQGGSGNIMLNATTAQFTEVTGTRTLGVQTRTTNIGGTNLLVVAGAGGTGAGANAGGTLTLQGGAGAGTNGNGGGIILTPGAKNGSGTAANVLIQPAASNDSTSMFNVKSGAGNNIFTVDSVNARVGIGLSSNTVPTLNGQGLEIRDGALRFSANSAGNKDSYVTPGGASVNTLINVQNYDPGTNSQIIAFGLPSTTSNANTRAISVFDARAGVHQPTISLFSVDENSVFGLSWDGSSTVARLKTDGINASQPSIVIQPAASTAGTAGGSTLNGGDVSVTAATATGGAASVLGGNATGSGTLTGGAVTVDGGTGATANGVINVGVTNSNAINIGSVGSTAKATTINIATTTSTSGAQLVTIGSAAANTGNQVVLQGGSSTTGGAEAIRLTPNTAGSIAIGATAGTGTITLGQSTATNIINIGAGATANTFTQTINIGNGTDAGTGKAVVTVGNTNGASSLTLQAGTGNIVLNVAGTVRGTFDNANSLYLGNGLTAGAPNDFMISGTGSTTTAVTGGGLTIQGGSATVGTANGGNLTLSGGAGFGGGVKGVVNVGPMVFTASTLQSFAGGGTITAANVNSFSTILVEETTTAGSTVALPDPTNTTIGHTIYVTSSSTSLDFTLSANAGTIVIAMRKNATATMIWNGADWTPGGADSSTTLQAAYNNTLVSAGGAEIVLNNNSNTGGLTIRDNSTSPITGSLLEVQSAIGTNILSVNDFSTELMANGGAEDSATFATNWSLLGTASAPTRTTTSGQFATGQAGVSSTFGTAAGNGVRGNLGTNPAVSTKYLVSFTAKLASGSAFTDLQVDYTPTGAATGTVCTTGQTVVTTTWTKITCEVTTPATGVTNPDILIYQPTLAGVSRVLYIDNLSVSLAASAGGLPSNVQIGGGINGGQISLFTLDRSSAAPVAGNNNTYLGSLYYDTTIGRIQCYESDGWGSCGSAPDNIIILTPEFAGATLNGTGIGTMTSDFCAQQATVLNINTTLCPSGEARNFYKWTSPQATQQIYSIYVSFKLPSTFKNFADDSTINLTARTDNTTNGFVTYEVFKSTGSAITACGTETTVTTTVNTWQTVPINGNENTTCAFGGSNTVIFKINVKSQSNAGAYVGNLTFTYTNN